MSSKKNKYDFISGLSMYNPTDKINNNYSMVNNFLNKTLTMFLYTGLPESIPYKEIEKLLQVNGIAFVTEYNDELVVLPITLLYDDVDVYGNAKSGNIYYPDTRKTVKVNLSEGVLFYNDFLGLGLMDIFKKYSYLINESDISLNIANVWKRTEKIFTANDDGTAESVKNYLDKVSNGDLGIIVSNILYESININTPNSNGSSIHELIEYNNYIKSQLHTEIGLYSNENMKKERLISSEVVTGFNASYPLVDNMFNSRLQAIEKLNAKYNLNVGLEFTSSWEYRVNLGENISKEGESNNEA